MILYHVTFNNRHFIYYVTCSLLSPFVKIHVQHIFGLPKRTTILMPTPSISSSLQVPCYSYGQKLSKLAILRIACNYILSLAQLAELDYSPDHSTLNFSQCVEQCTRTLQAEGRSKKRKVRLHSFSNLTGLVSL